MRIYIFTILLVLIVGCDRISSRTIDLDMPNFDVPSVSELDFSYFNRLHKIANDAGYSAFIFNGVRVESLIVDPLLIEDVLFYKFHTPDKRVGDAFYDGLKSKCSTCEAIAIKVPIEYNCSDLLEILDRLNREDISYILLINETNSAIDCYIVNVNLSGKGSSVLPSQTAEP